MLSRRHLRIKVMQTLYGYSHAGFDSVGAGEKELLLSINRYYELPLSTKLGNKEWLAHLHKMINDVQLLLPDHGPYHAQDWQNVMCEFDKWMRVRKGEGRPRSRYTPDTSYDI